MRALLLNPPAIVPIIREGRCQQLQKMRQTPIPQLSLAYIGALFEKAKLNVELLDCVALNLNVNKLVKIVRRKKFDLIIVNTSTLSIKNDMEIVKKLKQINPSCCIAIIGVHATVLHDKIIEKYPSVDVVIRGEPEITSLELAERIDKNERIDNVKGATVKVNNVIKVNSNRSWIEDLDTLPWPARHLLPNECYIHPIFNRPYTMITISRGCPYGCIFCVASIYYGKKQRKRNINKILDEIETDIIKKHKIRDIWFYADEFSLDRNFVINLCKGIIERDLDIVWWSNTRVDTIDIEMLKWMKKSGCQVLSLGVESGVQSILDNAKKGITLNQTIKAVKMCKKTGIETVAFFMFGLPTESKETIHKTIEFAKHINPDYVEFYSAVPYPGTKFYRIMKKQNLITDDRWENYTYDNPVIRTKDMTPFELKKMIKLAYHKFYFRPQFLISKSKKILNPSEFLKLCQFGLIYLGNI